MATRTAAQTDPANGAGHYPNVRSFALKAVSYRPWAELGHQIEEMSRSDPDELVRAMAEELWGSMA